MYEVQAVAVVRDAATWVAGVALYLTFVVIYALILTNVVGIAVIVGYDVIVRAVGGLRKLRMFFAGNTD